ncbi:MAG: putative mycofactocin radical SAM maturase MftC [Candidatus Scalindua arabica]|uniref:Mycofactocin radical SAM maturase MftC n=1 Tax=Candidatus Scalindua arabica TaxID=1127984 RepID=A0A941W439_9BACT|nr:putative mycofactocin radical SAM maturase MftC [Candidatus Scalindua arabica]
MINCSKLLQSTQTLSEIKRYSAVKKEAPKWMLRFSKTASPIVVWNVTRKCNLSCVHCYINAVGEDSDEDMGELTTREAMDMIEDLAAIKAPMLAFSGGEPLLREDIYELNVYAMKLGLRTILSTNSTLITREVAKKIKDAGFVYVGVSLDGSEKAHDEFRGAKGAFEKSLQGLRYLMKEGVRTGVRFAITNQNYEELSKVLEITKREKIPRFSLFQLVYGGRGKEIINWDIFNEQRRDVMDYVIEEARVSNGMNIVTADNYADGIYLLQNVAEREPERAAEVERLLAMQSGCPAGDGLANIDNRGDVHLCPYWQSRTMGNIREKKFSDIWFDEENEFLAKMRDKTRYIKDKCGRCKLNHLCMGCRVRAEVANGDPFGEDPACYLTEEEIAGTKAGLHDKGLVT